MNFSLALADNNAGTQMHWEDLMSGPGMSLAATDTCTGAVQHYTGTDTVQNGKIVAASIHQSG